MAVYKRTGWSDKRLEVPRLYSPKQYITVLSGPLDRNLFPYCIMQASFPSFFSLAWCKSVHILQGHVLKVINKHKPSSDRQAHNLTKRSLQLHKELKRNACLFTGALTLCNQSKHRYVASGTQGFPSEENACLLVIT